MLVVSKINILDWSSPTPAKAKIYLLYYHNGAQKSHAMKCFDCLIFPIHGKTHQTTDLTKFWLEHFHFRGTKAQLSKSADFGIWNISKSQLFPSQNPLISTKMYQIFHPQGFDRLTNKPKEWNYLTMGFTAEILDEIVDAVNLLSCLTDDSFATPVGFPIYYNLYSTRSSLSYWSLPSAQSCPYTRQAMLKQSNSNMMLFIYVVTLHKLGQVSQLEKYKCTT